MPFFAIVWAASDASDASAASVLSTGGPTRSSWNFSPSWGSTCLSDDSCAENLMDEVDEVGHLQIDKTESKHDFQRPRPRERRRRRYHGEQPQCDVPPSQAQTTFLLNGDLIGTSFGIGSDRSNLSTVFTIPNAFLPCVTLVAETVWDKRRSGSDPDFLRSQTGAATNV